MTRETTYNVARIEGWNAPPPTVPSERECVFQLTDAQWRVVFRDGERGLSGGLLRSRLTVGAGGARSCRLSVSDVADTGFAGTFVLRARAGRVRRDLEGRLASLERSGEVVREVATGSWWLDSRLFEDLDWSRRRSLAGVHYRAGWWGTGRLPPSMLPKVLDFGPRGVVLRGWRTRLVIPWDAIGSVRTLVGDCWVPTEAPTGHRRGTGTTVVIRSLTDQDAVFYTPLRSVDDVDALLGPMVDRLPGNVTRVS